MPKEKPAMIPASILDLGAADLAQKIKAKTGEPLSVISGRAGLNESSLFRVRNQTSQEHVWRKLARLAVEVGAV